LPMLHRLLPDTCFIFEIAPGSPLTCPQSRSDSCRYLIQIAPDDKVVVHLKNWSVGRIGNRSEQTDRG
jgi:hypothetical protein